MSRVTRIVKLTETVSDMDGEDDKNGEGNRDRGRNGEGDQHGVGDRDGDGDGDSDADRNKSQLPPITLAVRNVSLCLTGISDILSLTLAALPTQSLAEPLSGAILDTLTCLNICVCGCVCARACVRVCVCVCMCKTRFRN